MSETTLISVRVTAEVAKRLAALAKRQIARNPISRRRPLEDFLSFLEWQIKATRKGIAEADAGELAGHKEVLVSSNDLGHGFTPGAGMLYI